ncbi:MAG: FHA domain-containing protein [Planctomycetaceae bacterium]
MLGELIPCGGGDPIPLLKNHLIVGRRSRCDVSLRFPNVSSHHCELEFLDGYWIIRDLGSRNGIKVNGTRCDSKWLMPGDIVSIAKHRYEISYTPTGDSPPPEEENPFALGLLEKAGLTSRKRPERRSVKPEKWTPDQNDSDPVMQWLGDQDSSRTEPRG